MKGKVELLQRLTIKLENLKGKKDKNRLCVYICCYSQNELKELQ